MLFCLGTSLKTTNNHPREARDPPKIIGLGDFLAGFPAEIGCTSFSSFDRRNSWKAIFGWEASLDCESRSHSGPFSGGSAPEPPSNLYACTDERFFRLLTSIFSEFDVYSSCVQPTFSLRSACVQIIVNTVRQGISGLLLSCHNSNISRGPLLPLTSNVRQWQN